MENDEYYGVGEGDRILWGRVGVFAGAILLALLLGRCTTGGSDVSQTEFEELQDTNAQLQDANESLQTAVTSLEQRIQEIQQAPTTSGTEGPGGATEPPTAGGPEAGQTYIVQENDTLSGIASKVYGDPTKFGIIAEANGITADNPLKIGQELTIPPNPDA